MALSGILQVSFAAEAREARAPGSAPPSTPSKGKGKRPRYPDGALRPSFQTARADQKYYDDLDAGIPEPEAFRRHKNRFRALMHATYAKGQAQRWPAPPIQSHKDVGIAKTSFDD